MTKNTKKILSLIIFLVLIISLPIYYFNFLDKSSIESNSPKIKVDKSWQEGEFGNFESLGLTIASNYLISTSDKLASEAGSKILAKGGNAVDAAIAAQMVLNVVEPQSSGIGGGAFLLYRDAKTKETIYFNGRETAPTNTNSKIFIDKDGNPKKFHDAVKGGLSVGTPGLLKMLKSAHDKYGKLPWADLFASAIEIANGGFIVNERIYNIAKDLEYLGDFGEFAKIYLKDDGTPKEIGSVINNPDIANTFSKIAKDGINDFYNGEVAKNIVNQVQNTKLNPGFLSLDDLKSYQEKTGDLICGKYRKYKVCSMPIPSSGGITLLQILGILENFDLSKYKPSTVESINLISQATVLAYADRKKYIGDVESVPVEQMLDKKYLKSRSELIKDDIKIEDISAGEFEISSQYLVNQNAHENPSTTHISVIDMQGNAVAMTSSIEYTFGSALIVDGFILNNQLTDFSFIDEVDGVKVANSLAPGKQPMSSMTPTFVFDENDELILIVGSPGGKRIIQYVLKTIIAYLDWNLNIARSIALPNFTVFDNVIELEKGTEIEKLGDSLKNIGYEVMVKDITSGINAINLDIANKRLTGSADFRRNGVAIGN